jgi:hypothetical protein
MFALSGADSNNSPSLFTNVGKDGPYTSASKIPTLNPCCLSPNATLTATVLLPTPPLQLDTAIIFFIWDKLPFLSNIFLSCFCYSTT